MGIKESLYYLYIFHPRHLDSMQCNAMPMLLRPAVHPNTVYAR